MYKRCCGYYPTEVLYDKMLYWINPYCIMKMCHAMGICNLQTGGNRVIA